MVVLTTMSIRWSPKATFISTGSISSSISADFLQLCMSIRQSAALSRYEIVYMNYQQLSMVLLRKCVCVCECLSYVVMNVNTRFPEAPPRSPDLLHLSPFYPALRASTATKARERARCRSAERTKRIAKQQVTRAATRRSKSASFKGLRKRQSILQNLHLERNQLYRNRGKGHVEV